MESWQATALIALCSVVCLPAQAREYTEDELIALPLHELMQLPVTIASDHESAWRDQPGIITVFTSADIRHMGAKTLLDVVQRIPGTAFGIDVRNSIGLSMRGNWTLEGKILVLMDDMPLNELLYGSWSPLPYVPVTQIDRVEILRGPGSTKYGGSAQLAVIRIYTRRHSNETHVDATYLDQSGVATNLLSFGSGLRKNELDISVAGSLNRGFWGNETWVDNTGAHIDTSDADTSGRTLSLLFDWKHTHYKAYYEQFELDPIQGFGTADLSSNIEAERVLMSLSHDVVLPNHWTLTPGVDFRNDDLNLTSPAEPTVFDISAHNLRGSLDANWDYRPDASVNVGADYQSRAGRANETTGPIFAFPTNEYFNGEREQAYYASSIHADWNFKLGNYHISTGARSSHHNYAGDRLTPRLGITRSTDNWHIKWLYGQAFREPDIETIHYGTHAEKLEPEVTTVQEIELGHRIIDHGYLTLSLFRQCIRDTIIYNQDDLLELNYNNNPEMETHGAEMQFLYQRPLFSLQANFSFTHSNDRDVPIYSSNDGGGQYLGTAARIANVWLDSATGIRDLRFLLSARYVSTRTAWQFDPAVIPTDGVAISEQNLAAEFTVNSALRYDIDKITVTLGVDNIGNRQQWMPQPYEGLSTPFPYGSRTAWLRGEWRW